MEVVPTNFTITEYCQQLDRNEIQVNRKYQRSDKVWPRAARSFLIETILLGFPVPKLSLYQQVDLKTRKSIKEIVDGQQRSSAILDFYQDKFRLSKSLETEEVAGKSYSALPDDFKGRFLNYRLAADIFVGADAPTIREVFRRINSYNVPLNPEENRHATFQGAFKWFIYRLSKSYDSVLARLGVFGEKQFVRMADTKLYTEIVHAFVNGIKTTKKPALDAMYKKFEAGLDQQEEYTARIQSALERIDDWEELHGSALMKPHMVYALILAVSHVRDPLSVLNDAWPIDGPMDINDDVAKQRLSELADALDNPEEHKEDDLHAFVLASTSKTNVESQRAERFRRLCQAVTGELE